MYTERDQVDDAIKQYEAALRIRSNMKETRYDLSSALFYNNLGNALVRKGRLEEAIGNYRKAVALRPDYADAHFDLGSALLQEDRVREAISEWQKTVSINPLDLEAEASLGDAFVREHRVAEAITCYEKILRIVPNSVLILNKLAWIRATCPDNLLRNAALAMELAERANRNSGGANPIILRTLAAAYAEAGRFNNAIETAGRASQVAAGASNDSLLKALQKDLDLYLSSSALRDFGLANARSSQ